MERIVISSQLRLTLKKYGWPLLILVAGMLLMGLPKETASEPEPARNEMPDSGKDLSEQLEDLLEHVSGAGQVRLLLTEASGAVTHYQTDQDQSNNGQSGDLRQDTVILTESDRSQTGLVRRVDPPVYQGAVVICQGADSPAVRLAMVEAVSKATGLSTDKISVLKMK